HRPGGGDADDQQRYRCVTTATMAGALVPLHRPLTAEPTPATHIANTKFEFLEIRPMGIFSRTRDIIAANMTDLLDRSEDPAKMIRMIIMEMEETLVEVRASAARTIADQKEMKRAMMKASQAVQDWQDKAELALSKGREDLAKAALTEKNKAKAFIDTTQVEIDLLNETLSLNEADIAKLEGKLREARNRQNALLNRIESATQRSRLREMIRGPRVEEAFSRFEILERRADMAEGRADALGLAGPGGRSLEDEFAALQGNDEVDAELAAMKARLGKSEG
ncbi:MAG: phage shock protein PspA, partial [Pseudomonadota bacterium]